MMTKFALLIVMTLAFGQTFAQQTLPKSYNLDSESGSGSTDRDPNCRFDLR